jgi:hypothetical protein
MEIDKDCSEKKFEEETGLPAANNYEQYSQWKSNKLMLITFASMQDFKDVMTRIDNIIKEHKPPGQP